MKTKYLFPGLLTVSLLACSGEGSSPYLSIAEPGEQPAPVDGGTIEPKPGESLAEMLSSFQPILEGRKYRIEGRSPINGVDAELEVFDVSLNGAPRVVPEVTVPFEASGTGESVPASALIALSCAYDVAVGSDVISPGLGEGVYALNPGTPVQNSGTDVDVFLYRNIPAMSSQVWFQAFAYGYQLELKDGCSSQMHWAQEMNLCIAERYMELAKADDSYELVVNPVQAPRSRVPPTDDQLYSCNDAQPLNRCQQLGMTLQPALAVKDGSAAREEGIKAYILAAIQGGGVLGSSYYDGFTEATRALRIGTRNDEGFFDEVDVNIPPQGDLSDAEYLDVLVGHYMRPIARFPVQEQADRATLALLAVNYYLAAQDVGQRFINCQMDGNALFVDALNHIDHRWVDTYDHRSIRVNELVVGRLVEAMNGSIDAGELAQRLIMNQLDKGVSPTGSEKEHQQFWRGRTNSRLECVHTWHDLAPGLFQDPNADPSTLDESELFPVFSWRDSSKDVERVEQLIRDARINPYLIESGADDLAAALVASMQADLRFTFASDGPDPNLVLANMGITHEMLRSAALRIIDTSRALGRPIVELKGGDTMAEARPIVAGYETTPYFYTHGVQRTSTPADPIYLYGRSIGQFTNNQQTHESSLPRFAFSGISGAITYSGKALRRLAQSYAVPQPGGPLPFFPPSEPPFTEAVPAPPIATTPSASADASLVGMVEDGIKLANHLVPEVLWYCQNGFIIFHSDEAPTEVPEAWRGEAGLECAIKGSFDDVPCVESEYGIGYASTPAIPTQREYGSSGLGKFAMGGTLDLAEVEPALQPGELIYFTRHNAAGMREPIVAIAVAELEGTTCGYYPFGEALIQKVNTCLAASASNPSAPAFCCEEMPCDLKVPLEDTLQSTPSREVESSFMHYVSLAREAATRADQLGEELFRQGLEMDMRAEEAREELEDKCGGVVNIERLAPRECTTNTDCCEGGNCTSECMPSSSLPDGQRFCTGGNAADALRSTEVNECGPSRPCSSGRTCVADDQGSFCAPSCAAMMPCAEGACITSAGQSFCALECDADKDCSPGMGCRQSSVAGQQMCMPLPTDDLRSVEQCLGVGSGEGALVTAAFGERPLIAWKFPDLPPCVCPTGYVGCPAAFEASTGQPTCPVLGGASGMITIPPGAERHDIPTVLGFETGLATGGAGSPAACKAIARLRANNYDALNDTAFGDIETMFAQPWLSNAKEYAVLAKTVDPEYDPYGFLSIFFKQATWLSTGSATSGPLIDNVFPNVPVLDDDANYAEICQSENPLGGRPLQCKWFGGSDDYELSNEQLVRMTQIIRLLAQGHDGDDRIPIAEHVAREPRINPEIGDADETFIAMFDLERPLPPDNDANPMTPHWLGDDAQIVPVTTARAFASSSSNQQRMVPRILINEFSNHSKDAGYSTSPPQCLVGAEEPWNTLLGCGDSIPFPGTSTARELETFNTYMNGDYNAGLWATRYTTGAAPGVGRNNTDPYAQYDYNVGWHAKRAFEAKLSRSLYSMVDRIRRGDTNLGAGDDAPILNYQKWPYTDGKPTVSEVMDSLELMCLMATNPGGPQVGMQAGCPPEVMSDSDIASAKDFPKLTRRLRCAADRIDGQLQRMWIPEIPPAVATALYKGEVTGTVPVQRGEFAETIADMQGAFQTISEATRSVASQLRQFSYELEMAQSTLEEIDDQSKILDWRLAADISNQVAACASSAASAKSFTGGTAISCANAAVQIASLVAVKNLQEKVLDADKRQALISLSMQFGSRLDSVEDAADRLNEGYTNVQHLMAQLDIVKQAAQRAAAKASFQDSDASGRVYNVNTAMRRNMNTLRVRYDEALSDAKKMSFIARRSIEQRLGMDMAEMSSNLLLVDAPSGWADSACSMTGIDYDRIRDASGSAIGESVADDFSKGFIGNYVTNLENFVESYRFQYPFNDGRDVAVVSLRDDILGVRKPCDIEGPNLLFFTADMLAPGNVDDDGQVIGWQDVSDEGTAMTLTDIGGSPRGAQLSDSGIAIPPTLPGGHAYEMSTVLTPADPQARPYWGQRVWLEEGLYQLSWYERYGSSDNGCETAPWPSWTYVVPSVEPIEGGSINLEAPELAPFTFGVTTEVNRAEELIQSCWRRWYVNFEVGSGREVMVRFGLNNLISQAIWSSPQLEVVPQENIEVIGEEEGGGVTTFEPPRAYFPTGETLSAQAGLCEDTYGDRFQSMFQSGASFCEPICPDGTGESCAATGTTASLAMQCYHQLEFAITPGEIERGEIVSVARTNFNYRFSRFGINLVGTGVRDCESSQFPSSCYASGYIPYTLQHDGPYTITNHDGDRVDVPLYKGRIEHAKALTAERFLTTPLSGADRTLMEDFWRNELRGRPLQGQYMLRIYDVEDGAGNNVLQMDNLEDVQLIFEYNYWTRSEQ